MTTPSPAPVPTVQPLPRTAPEMRGRITAIVDRLLSLEDACRTAEGRDYREISREMNCLEEEALMWDRIATRLERQAEEWV